MSETYPVLVTVVAESNASPAFQVVPESFDWDLVKDLSQFLADKGLDPVTQSGPWSQHKGCIQLLHDFLGFTEGVDTGKVSYGGWETEPDRPIWSVNGGDGFWWPRGGASWEINNPNDPAAEGEPRLWLSLQVEDDGDLQSCTWLHSIQAPEPSYGVVLIFANSRTQIEGVDIADTYPLPGGISPHVRAKLPSGQPLNKVWQISYLSDVFNVNRDCERRVPVPVPIQVTYRGDPPILKDTIWLVSDEAAPETSSSSLALLQDSPPPPAPAVYHVLPEFVGDKLNGLANYARSYAEQFDQRQIENGQLDDELQRHAAFFLALDRETAPVPGAVPEPDLEPEGVDPQTAYRDLGTYLMLQYFVRAEVLLTENSATLTALSDSVKTWEQYGKTVAGRVKAIMIQHYPGTMEGLDLASMRAGFEAFARGELAIDGVQGVPNGTNYFSFVELGLLMIESNQDGVFWKPVTEVLARTTEIYVRSFHHCGEPWTFCAYGLGHSEGPQPWSQAERDELDAAWSGLTTEGWKLRYAQVVASALRDEFGELANTPGAQAASRLNIVTVGCKETVKTTGLRRGLRSRQPMPPREGRPPLD